MAQSLPISSLPSGGVIQATDATVVVRGGLNYQVTVPVDLIYQNAATLLTKANINSPAFTGVPTAPTAAAGTNTTQLATTAFVRANTPSRTILADNNTWTGTNTYTVSPIVPTPVVTDTTTTAANMAAINQAVTGYTSIDVSTAVSGVITITADQIRLQWLAFTGTLTSDVVIEFPASVGKFMMIKSSVITGAFSLTVGKVSGSASTYPLYTGTSLWFFTATGLGCFSTLYNSTLYGNSFYNHDIATNDNSYRIANTAFVQDISVSKADLNSPAFTGVPTAPTATAGTNTTQLATTAFVTNAVALKANLASPSFTGTPTAPTAVAGTNTTQLATTAFVANAVALKANLASPSFTGTPTAPTAVAGTNTTQLATTQFVTSAVTAGGGGIVASGTGWVKFANGLILQFGQTVVFGTTPQVQNLPVAFSNSTYDIFLAAKGTNALTNNNIIYPNSSSSFALESAAGTTVNGSFFAIGY